MAKLKLKSDSAKKTTTYNADSLKSLKYPENVRHRPGMFISSVDEPGVRRIWKEILDNSVDEHGIGHGNTIVVEYNTKKNMFLVADQGRGAPSGMNKKEGKSGFELVFATLHGSGKFDQSNYVTSSGVHGVGASCTQSLSSHFQAWSHNEGLWKTQTFKKGYAVSKVEKGSPAPEFAKAKKGTVVQWVPDTEIFKDARIDIQAMHETCKHLTMLNPGLEIIIRIDGKETKYKSENGLLDMVYGTKEQQESSLTKPFQYQKKSLIDIAVVWNDDDLQQTWSYVNSSHTPEEGTHVQGARNALLEALRAELTTATKSEKTKQRNSKSKQDDTLDAKYLLMGSRMALNWRMSNPVYSGQTKDKLTNAEVVTTVKNTVLPEFSSFLKKNPKLISTLIDRAKKFQKAAEKFQQDLKAVKSIRLFDPNSRGVLPGKLTQAHGYKPDEKELIFVEGDSAESGCKKARMPWQEVLPLRGKLPNPIRTETSKFMANSEVSGIFTAIGVLPGGLYSSKTRRVGRLGFLPDADPDGRHINSELIAFVSRYLPDFLEQGKVFYIDAPLFVGSYRGVKKFANSTDELLNKFPEKDRKHVLVTRMKGWAEASAEDMRVIAMDPSTRKVVQLTTSDADALVVNNIMGDDVAHRKEMLGIKEGVK